MPAASNAAIGRAAVARAAGFFVLWLVLDGVEPAGLPVGVIAAAAATWTSLRLLPPGTWHFRPGALAGFALRFLSQSVIAGVDVAWRALDPRHRVRPGFVVCPLQLPPGSAQATFCTLTSLLPGTVPSGVDENGALIVHCLDIGQPVVSQLAAEESRFIHACGGAGDD